jgi:hypothetical protein
MKANTTSILYRHSFSLNHAQHVSASSGTEKWNNTYQDSSSPLPLRYLCTIYHCLDAAWFCDFDMDMSYTRVLHIKVAYRVPHEWRHAFYVTRQQLCARITCCVTVITRPLLCARITCHVTVIKVEINHCRFRRVRFALLYIVTRSKIV